MTKIYGYGVREKLANYASALEGCGAECVFSLDVEEALDCQGLLLPGGGDIDPARYGQPSDGSEAPDLQRDAAELELVSRFLAWGRPILGICRGIQLLNVALGGDWDGCTRLPEGIGGIQDMDKLYEALLRRNYSEELVRGLFYTNLMRVVNEVCNM